MTHQQEEPILRLNQETDSYEGYLKVQVPAELFRRRLLTEVEQHTSADLTNPATWAQAIAKVGKITCWLDRPHVTITPVGGIPSAIPSPQQQPVPTPATQTKSGRAAPGTAKPSYSEIELDLRQRAREIPPYQWGQLVTPILKGVRSDTIEYKRNSYVRSDEKKALAILIGEWTEGTYQLSPEAAEAQAFHEAGLTNRLSEKIGVVATVVNGSRLR